MTTMAEDGEAALSKAELKALKAAKKQMKKEKRDKKAAAAAASEAATPGVAGSNSEDTAVEVAVGEKKKKKKNKEKRAAEDQQQQQQQQVAAGECRVALRVYCWFLAGWEAHRLCPTQLLQRSARLFASHPLWAHGPSSNAAERRGDGRAPPGGSWRRATADSITLGSPVGAVTLWVLPSMRHFRLQCKHLQLNFQPAPAWARCVQGLL
jgi:hypothetical protein